MVIGGDCAKAKRCVEAVQYIMNDASPEWKQWIHNHPGWNQRDRYPLIQVITIERTTLRVVEDEIPIPKILGLTVNASSGGLCLLADWSPKAGEIFRIHLPLSTVEATTPTLADVRWVRPLPFENSGLSMVGLKFLV
jgi:PilZ domain-containing protein